MNTSTMRGMIAVAALAVAAGSASVQTFKADIPMAFRVGDKLMAPGSYQVRVAAGHYADTLFVRNLDTNTAAMLLPGPKSDAPKAWVHAGAPRLTIECLGSTCSLRRLWTAQDRSVYNFQAPKAPPNVEARGTTLVTLAMVIVH